jgi:hypothetical protein
MDGDRVVQRHDDRRDRRRHPVRLDCSGCGRAAHVDACQCAAAGGTRLQFCPAICGRSAFQLRNRQAGRLGRIYQRHRAGHDCAAHRLRGRIASHLAGFDQLRRGNSDRIPGIGGQCRERPSAKWRRAPSRARTRSFCPCARSRRWTPDRGRGPCSAARDFRERRSAALSAVVRAEPCGLAG